MGKARPRERKARVEGSIARQEPPIDKGNGEGAIEKNEPLRGKEPSRGRSHREEEAIERRSH